MADMFLIRVLLDRAVGDSREFVYEVCKDEGGAETLAAALRDKRVRFGEARVASVWIEPRNFYTSKELRPDQQYEVPVEDAHKAAGFELVAEGDDVKAKPGDIVQKGSDGVRRIYRKGA